jgi:predicted ATPase
VRIDLEPLSERDGQTLLSNLLGVEGLPVSLRERILSRAEGNPFYIEEVIRSLIDQGVITHDEQGGEWRASSPQGSLPIPETLTGVLTARIDALPEETRRVLQIAAVIGRIFPARVLAEITAGEAQLEPHLLALQHQELIRERTAGPQTDYIFKHELTREAAYNGLLLKERRQYHRRVAKAIERLYADRSDELVELLALHWQRAEEPLQATRYLMRAGERASHLGASWQAIEHYEAALRLVSTAGVSAGVPEHVIHERLGDVYYEHLSRQEDALGHYREFLQSARGAEEAARRRASWPHCAC